ncbi:MAG: response regulator [Desulfobacterales bacterium]|nr:response regulator [Desulfobacterales bacterium]
MVDLPAYHELEEKIAQLESELNALSGRDIKGDPYRILGQVAHEFNNLMMVIQGNISIMLDDILPNTPGYERLKNMERYIRRGTRLTEQILNYVALQDRESDPSILAEPVVTLPGHSRGLAFYQKTSQGVAHVLLVDDEGLILDVGNQMLEKIGMAVTTASSGHEAVKVFEANAAQIDLVILDLIMPGIDGIDTFHLLRAVDPYIKVLIASGYRKDQRVELFLKERHTGFIKKPFSLSQLAEKVRSLLFPL